MEFDRLSDGDIIALCKRNDVCPSRDIRQMVGNLKKVFDEETSKRKNIFNSLAHKQDKATSILAPPYWSECPAMGEDIYQIFGSKVPLGEIYTSNDMLNKVKELGKTVGLVIELTNSSCNYEIPEWLDVGSKHVKIKSRRGDNVPDNESVTKFVYEVSKFVSSKGQTECIIVYCTYGFNHTGYMIVHYLVRELRFSVLEAINKFASARPPGIYKPEFIVALFSFYHVNRPKKMCVLPPIPEWDKSNCGFLGDAVSDDDNDGDSTAPGQAHYPV